MARVRDYELAFTWQGEGSLQPPDGEGWKYVDWKPGPGPRTALPVGDVHGVWIMWRRLTSAAKFLAGLPISNVPVPHPETPDKTSEKA